MSNDNYTPNQNPTLFSQGPDSQRSIKSIRTYLVITALALVVSFYIAGLILCIVGIVCSIVALRKTLQLEKRDSQIKQSIKYLKILSIAGICACVLALVITVISIVIMLPLIVEAAQTGDFSSLGLGSSTKDSSPW